MTSQVRDDGNQGVPRFARAVVQTSVWLLLIFGLQHTARAQTPAFLVKDINTMTGCIPYGSYPSFLTNVNGVLFFLADDGMHGVELWRSDGTESGTVLVKDINPAGSAFGFGSGHFTTLNNTVFFVADDGTSGAELWNSDGTAAGTMPLTHFNAGPDSSVPWALAVANGRLFFLRGTELWQSDGTEGGTVRVAGIATSDGSNPDALTVVGGTLFFLATGEHGTQLWRSDGSTAGTMPVTEVPASAGLTALNNTLILFAPRVDGAAYGRNVELWKSDGSAAGTMRFATIERVSEWGVTADQFTAANGTLFFVTHSYVGYPPESPQLPALWRSDGTDAGTVRVASFPSTYQSFDLLLTPFNGALYLAEYAGQLFRTDGTANGTTLVKDLACESALVDVGGRLIFQACAATGCGLWESDGTTTGTRRLTGVVGGPPTVAGPLAFFSGQFASPEVELWAVPLAGLGRCGNGMLDPGEECDTGGESAACDVDCTLPVCGDGTLNRAAGEECDGGSNAGDCCTAGCMFESAGDPCGVGNVCNGACDGAGQCQSGIAQPAGTLCGDGDACNGAETCDGNGMCQSGTALQCDDSNPHTVDSCDPLSGCMHMASCAGDCNADGAVTIDEVIMMMTDAFKDGGTLACPAGDADHNGTMTVDEVLVAVNHALNECPNTDDGGGFFDDPE